ncbi:MAG: sugar phosphate isomerase/epimerase [Verrucomicrobiota bacterium]
MTPSFSSLLSRRHFVRVLALSAGAGVAQALRSPAAPAPASPGKIPVGSNIYGWGQYYQREGKKIEDHLDDVLSALRDAGYDYLEGFVDVNTPENNARFAEKLRLKGLRPVCLYSGARLHETGKASESVSRLLEAAKVCQKAGFTIIDCNPDPIGRAKTDEELNVQAQALNDLGRGLKALGMRLGIHNHTPEMANNAREFHHIFAHTDPGLVGLCYDVHWVYRGGISPQDCLARYGTRVVSWHLRQSRAGIWWEELDGGDVDYSAVARFAKDNHLLAPYTVELALEEGTKVTRSVVENHRRSRDYVRRVFGV